MSAIAAAACDGGSGRNASGSSQRLGDAEHAADGRQQAGRRVRPRVAALLDQHQLAVGVPVGQGAGALPEPAEAGHGHALAAVRVVLVRVLAGRDDDEVGVERRHDRRHDLVERRQVGVVAAAQRQLHVDVVAGAGAAAGLGRRAGLRMARAPAAVRHVPGDREHVVALVEQRLRAVAVVDVPVQDRHPLLAAAARVLGRQRGVVEEAVAVGRAARGVVAGWPHQRVRQRRVAVQHGVAGADGGARGRQQGGPGARRRQRRARPPAAVGRSSRAPRRCSRGRAVQASSSTVACRPSRQRR